MISYGWIKYGWSLVWIVSLLASFHHIKLYICLIHSFPPATNGEIWKDLDVKNCKKQWLCSLAPKRRTPLPRLRRSHDRGWVVGRCNRAQTYMLLCYEPLRCETGLPASTPWLKFGEIGVLYLYAGSAPIGWAATWSKSIECLHQTHPFPRVTYNHLPTFSFYYHFCK